MPFGVLLLVLKDGMKSVAGSDAPSWLLQRLFRLAVLQTSAANLEHRHSHFARIVQRLCELREPSFEGDEGWNCSAEFSILHIFYQLKIKN